MLSQKLRFLPRKMLQDFSLRVIFPSHGVLERAEWFTVRFYYKLAIFKRMHKAYNRRLPSTLISVLRRNVICHAQLEHAIH